MQCPKCDNAMESVAYKTVEVDRCISCKGIWFDMLEHEVLKELKGSETIDTGEPRVEKILDQTTRCSCPVCHTVMIGMVDRDRPDIHYEACTVCYGAFFDAGEFSQYKQHSVSELLADLFSGSIGRLLKK
ncbi:MAG: zf-TFIIB domain-containing protein [Gammaproteobacteria bacterium]|nr:zf-TFIIB domain-containing protein [Gammaproteobacteria bacterium]NNF62296.1 zf-TFIIB domain-containing protein [Gammaproteobacteria bacterium]NNM21249.1 zf-TFIIB domain-containing protein [Gammaproteobacteria bacterium]